MSTYMAKAKELQKEWYIIDAADKPLGRVAAAAATILRGKHKPTYTPHADCGDFVIIINSDKAVLTGNKLEQKMWYRHTGYVGGLKAVKYADLMEKRSEKAMELAVWGMLPHNTLGRSALTRCHIYKGAEHKHSAQKPILWDREIK
ncbi:MAG: 50S ribosomal protein L13 [Clostridia bacterium]|nr:50S ribosomal protein L13 [Clostridia bacterium]